MLDSEETRSPHIDEGTLHAWLDGALTDDQSVAVQRHVAECSSCASAVTTARGLIAASTRILAALDDVPGGVIPGGGHGAVGATTPTSRRARGRPSLRSARLYAPIAAAAALAITATLLSRTSTAPPDRPTRANEQSRPAVSTRALDKLGTPRATGAPGQRAGASASTELSTRGGADVATSREQPASSAKAAFTEPGTDVAKTVGSASPASPASPASGGRGASTSSQARSADAQRLAEAGAVAAPSPPRDSLAITGRVVTTGTGEPVNSANVAVVGTGTVVVTDSTGAFAISGVAPGTHTVVARRLGFGAARTQVDVPIDRAAIVTLSMPRSPLALSGVMVSSEDILRKAGFDDAPRVISGARVISSELSAEAGVRTRSTLYQLNSGVRFTLTESHPGGSPGRPNPAASNRAGAARAAAASGSVSWIGSDGTSFVLSGQLTDAELAAIRKQIAP